MAALGAQALFTANAVPGLEPISPAAPGRLFSAFASGVVLVGAGAAILFDKSVRSGVLAVAGLMGLWVLILHLPLLIADPANGSEWTGALETLAIGGAAWMMAGLSSAGRPSRDGWDRLALPGEKLGRVCYGVALPGFGVLHFIYSAYVSAAIPGWIPGPQFWTYATGLAHIAAGLSIVTGVLARLGATLLAVMFGSWVLLLHAPRVAARPHDRNEWASLLIALAMCGGACVVAAAYDAGRLTMPNARSPRRMA